MKFLRTSYWQRNKWEEPFKKSEDSKTLVSSHIFQFSAFAYCTNPLFTDISDLHDIVCVVFGLCVNVSVI